MTPLIMKLTMAKFEANAPKFDVKFSTLSKPIFLNLQIFNHFAMQFLQSIAYIQVTIEKCIKEKSVNNKFYSSKSLYFSMT